MPIWASIVFYVLDVFFASAVVFGLNFLAQVYPAKIPTLQLSYSGIIFFVVAGIAFELFKMKYDRDKYAEYLRIINTCDPNSRKLVESILRNLAGGFVSKVPFRSIKDEMNHELTVMTAKVEDWHSNRLETRDANWINLDLQMLREARKTIQATSCDFMNEFWNSFKGKNYLERNCEQRRMKIEITRIFILTEREERNTDFMRVLEETIKKHVENDITVKIRRATMDTINPDDNKDFAIYDRTVVSHTVSPNTTLVHWDPGTLQIWEARFNRLLADSVPVHECFPNLRNDAG